MSGVNKAIVIGRLGQDPELNTHQTAVTQFAILAWLQARGSKRGAATAKKRKPNGIGLSAGEKPLRLRLSTSPRVGRFILRARLNIDRMRIRTE